MCARTIVLLAEVRKVGTVHLFRCYDSQSHTFMHCCQMYTKRAFYYCVCQLRSNSGRFGSKVNPEPFQIEKQLNSIRFDKMSVLYVTNLDQNMSPTLYNVIEHQLQCPIKVIKEYEDGDLDIAFFRTEDLDKAFNVLNHKKFGNRPLNLFKNEEM